MKKLLVIALIMSFLSCNTNVQDQENIGLVQNYIDAVENLDFDDMGKYLHDNYMGYGPSINDSINKNQAIKNWQNNVLNVYEKIDYESSRVVSVNIPDGPNAGEWVSNWAQLRINYKDSDAEALIWANTVYQVEEDKIIKSYTFYNEADVLEQLGFFFLHQDQFN